MNDFIIRVAAACVTEGITNAEFNALVGDLITAVNKFNIGARSQATSLVVPSKCT